MTAAQGAGKKKSLHAAERDPERVRTLRTAVLDTGQALDVRRLQCVDASGTTLAMMRRYGRAPPGPRVVDSVPVNSGENSTLLAAVGLDGLHAPWGDSRCWEHLSAHTVAGVDERRTARGARLLRLSPSSPDFHPIAQCWSKSKTWLRRAKARTVDALFEAIKDALDTVTEADIRGWFAHCGYPVH